MVFYGQHKWFWAFLFFACLFTSQKIIYHKQRCLAHSKFCFPDAVGRAQMYGKMLAWYTDGGQEEGILLSLAGASTVKLYKSPHNLFYGHY